MTKTFFSLVIQEKSVLQPSLIPLPTESYLPINNAYLKLEKPYQMAARTFWKLHRDVSDCTSGHNGYYVGTYQMLHRDVISSLPWQCVAIRWQ